MYESPYCWRSCFTINFERWDFVDSRLLRRREREGYFEGFKVIEEEPVVFIIRDEERRVFKDFKSTVEGIKGGRVIFERRRIDPRVGKSVNPVFRLE